MADMNGLRPKRLRTLLSVILGIVIVWLVYVSFEGPNSHRLSGGDPIGKDSTSESAGEPQRHGWAHFGSGSHDKNSHHSQGSSSDRISKTSAKQRKELEAMAEKTFLMVKTGAVSARSRLPVHFHVTLPRWPNHAIYGDLDMEVMGYHVIGLFDGLPDFVRDSEMLAEFRELKELEKNNWMRDTTDLLTKEGWKTDKFKNMPMLGHAYLNAPTTVEWFIFIDDDTYVFQASILQWLKQYDGKKPWYFGNEAPTVVSDGDEIKPITFAHGGSGVVISRGALEKVFGSLEPKEEATTRINEIVQECARSAVADCCGDAVVAQELYLRGGVEFSRIWDQAPHTSPFQALGPCSERLTNENWCQPIFSWHWVTQQQIEQLYNMEMSLPDPTRGVTYADFYSSAILPVVVDSRKDWAFYAPTVIVNSSTVDTPEVLEILPMLPDVTYSPYESAETCQRFCEFWSKCWSWSYHDNTCDLYQGALMMGQANNDHHKGYVEMTDLESGFMVDRIRRFRSQAQCDPLKFEKNVWNDSPDTSEGWLLRKLSAQSAEN